MTAAKPAILVTYDGSEVSKTAFPAAARLARLMQADILLIQVLHAPPEIWSHPDAAYRETELAAFKQTAQAEVDAIAATLSSEHGIAVVGQARILGERWNVPGEILAAADEADVEMICMATHGEGGIRRLFLGSTSQEVIAASTRPVTLVRAGKDE